MRFRGPLLAASLLLIVAAPAQASLGRWGLDQSGDPSLSVQWVPSPFADDPAWRACPPGGGACAALGNGERAVLPGETAAGTVFESDITTPSGRATERSPAWQGRVTSLAAPGIQGELVTGGALRPTAGRWSGGWGDELSTNVLIACPALSGPGCEYLAIRAGYSNNGFEDRPVSARIAGWYVYAVEYRYARDANPYVQALPPPPGGPAARPVPSALVAVSAPVGPIATPAPVTKDVPPAKVAAPSVVIRKRALRSGRRVTVARVRCVQLCSVELRVSDGRRTLKRTLHVKGSAPLTIVRGERLRPGLLRVRVAVDGRPAVIGRVRLKR